MRTYFQDLGFVFNSGQKILTLIMYSTSLVDLKHMIQKCNIQKDTEDNHYCNTLYCYASELILDFKKYISFKRTDDKNKTKVGEPNCPLSVRTCGKKVLVAQSQVLQAADHNFASITFTPTVILLHDISEKINQSW